MTPPWLSERPDGVVIHLLVQPRASKNEVVGVVGDELKVRLTSPPVDGAANRLCCEFLAKQCGIAKSCVVLEAGETSRHKRLKLMGVSAAEVARAMGLR